jgi:hypothetical protein
MGDGTGAKTAYQPPIQSRKMLSSKGLRDLCRFFNCLPRITHYTKCHGLNRWRLVPSATTVVWRKREFYFSATPNPT